MEGCYLSSALEEELTFTVDASGEPSDSKEGEAGQGEEEYPMEWQSYRDGHFTGVLLMNAAKEPGYVVLAMPMKQCHCQDCVSQFLGHGGPVVPSGN